MAFEFRPGFAFCLVSTGQFAFFFFCLENRVGGIYEKVPMRGFDAQKK